MQKTITRNGVMATADIGSRYIRNNVVYASVEVVDDHDRRTAYKAIPIISHKAIRDALSKDMSYRGPSNAKTVYEGVLETALNSHFKKYPAPKKPAPKKAAAPRKPSVGKPKAPVKKVRTPAKKPATRKQAVPKKPVSKPTGRPQVLKASKIQTGKSDKKRDTTRKAMSPGKRKSATGRIYYEYRRNRSDVRGRKT
jgi:hypothetical protein